jgi:hypothetical protein
MRIHSHTAPPKRPESHFTYEAPETLRDVRICEVTGQRAIPDPGQNSLNRGVASASCTVVLWNHLLASSYCLREQLWSPPGQSRAGLCLSTVSNAMKATVRVAIFSQIPLPLRTRPRSPRLSSIIIASLLACQALKVTLKPFGNDLRGIDWPSPCVIKYNGFLMI